MWDKLLFLTLITVFFPWSILVLLWLYGWDETVRIFREVVLDAFGTAAVVLMFLIALIFVALAIFWAYKDFHSFFIALVVVEILIGLSALYRRRKSQEADREIKRRQKLGYER